VYTLSIAQSGWFGGTVDMLLLWSKIAIVYTLVVDASDNVKDLRRLVFAVVIAVIVLTWKGWDIFLYTPERLTDAGRLESVGNYNLSNSFALALTVAAAFTFALLGTTRRLLGKLFYVLVIGLFAVTCVYTKSRGGNLGFAFAILFSIVVSRWIRSRALKGLLLAGVVVGIIASVPVILARGDVSGYFGGDSSAGDRLEVWVAGVKMIRDHPILGVGYKQFPDHLPDYGVERKLLAHNTLLSVTAETGIVGGFLFVMMIWTSLRALWTVWRTASRVPGRGRHGGPGRLHDQHELLREGRRPDALGGRRHRRRGSFAPPAPYGKRSGSRQRRRHGRRERILERANRSAGGRAGPVVGYALTGSGIAGWASVCRAAARLGAADLAARLAANLGRIPVLMYHSVSDAAGAGGLRSCLSLVGMQVSPATFGRQMDILGRERKVVSLAECVARLTAGAADRTPAAVITFDDGFVDNLANAVPALERLGFSATFFLIGHALARTSMPAIYRLYALLDALDHATLTVAAGAARVNGLPLSTNRAKLAAIRALQPVAVRGSDADRSILFRQLTDTAERHGAAPVPADTLFMDAARAKDLVRRGFALGAHSMSHARMTDLQPGAQLEEIRGSGAQIRALQGNGPLAFAYPFGDAGSYSAETGRLLRESGYMCAVTTRSGLCGQRSDPFELRRLEIGEVGDAEFRAAISGMLSFPKAAVRSIRQRSRR
jgi:peptidoglycan/xylan/chitin deacetylase (PgdA/CDA1 family)